MNVTIIGCGYVGTAVAQQWQKQGQKQGQQQGTVTVTTTSPSRLSQLESVANRAVLLSGSNLAGLQTLLADQQVVVLSVGARDRSAYEATYLTTAKNLVTALQTNATVQQVIYTSSYGVYGDHQGNWVTETSPLYPANRNGEILAETEQILLSAASEQRQICVLRLGGIYGPGRELIKIFGNVAGTTRPGDGSDVSNWVHLEDIVGAIDFARRQRLSGIYNLVQDEPISTGELFDQLFAKHGLPSVTWDSSQTSPRPYNAQVSNQKLRQAGYQFQHPRLEP
ncbi:MAG: NAD-dependent epimerase/dehydratase family protein [Elainella sp.]